MVIDIGIFIEYLQARNKTDTILYNIADEIEICISSVTLYELLMGATTKKKIKDIELLTNDLIILSFSGLKIL